MIFKRPLNFCITALLITIGGSAQTNQQSMKGYELYSWKIKGHWYYSLLPGTNRSKTYEEITAPERVKRGESDLKSELQKLPKGEEVFWRSDAPQGIIKPASGQIVEIKHPSRQRIKNIKAMCDRLGIRLKLT
jgi:hypothetical protein